MQIEYLYILILLRLWRYISHLLTYLLVTTKSVRTLANIKNYPTCILKCKHKTPNCTTPYVSDPHGLVRLH